MLSHCLTHDENKSWLAFNRSMKTYRLWMSAVANLRWELKMKWTRGSFSNFNPIRTFLGEPGSAHWQQLSFEKSRKTLLQLLLSRSLMVLKASIGARPELAGNETISQPAAAAFGNCPQTSLVHKLQKELPGEAACSDFGNHSGSNCCALGWEAIRWS